MSRVYKLKAVTGEVADVEIPKDVLLEIYHDVQRELDREDVVNYLMEHAEEYADSESLVSELAERYRALLDADGCWYPRLECVVEEWLNGTGGK